MTYLHWIDGDDSLVRYSVRVSDPRTGDDLTRDDVLASDAENAQIQVAEELAADTGEDFDVVSEWVGPATRENRYA